MQAKLKQTSVDESQDTYAISNNRYAAPKALTSPGDFANEESQATSMTLLCVSKHNSLSGHN